jgi:hypothetical protein
MSDVVKFRSRQSRPVGEAAAAPGWFDGTGSPLVDDNKVLAAALRRYLRREGLGLLRELDKALLLIASQLEDLQSGTNSCALREVLQQIDNQWCRNTEVTQNILNLVQQNCSLPRVAQLDNMSHSVEARRGMSNPSHSSALRGAPCP